MCRALNPEFYIKGQGHFLRSTTKESPKSACSDYNCAMQGLLFE